MSSPTRPPPVLRIELDSLTFQVVPRHDESLVEQMLQDQDIIESFLWFLWLDLLTRLTKKKCGVTKK